MTHPALMKMLEKYDLSNSNSSFDALREILRLREGCKKKVRD